MKYCLSPRAEPEGFPEGSGNISSYTLTQITIQSFSITSTSQYFGKIISISCDINLMVANWGKSPESGRVPAPTPSTGRILSCIG